MITQIHDLDCDAIDPLIKSSESEGFRFLTRLRDDWISGLNTFSRSGEVFYGSVFDGQLVAVGGLNRMDDVTGRLRRFYVMPEVRRRGVGRDLIAELISQAKLYYDRVVLYTDTEAAGQFYASCGFNEIADGDGVSHCIKLNKVAEQVAAFDR